MKLIFLLKELKRSGWEQHKIKGTIETTAAHTMGVTFIVWFFCNRKKIESEKLLKMALVHDLLESLMGDITPKDMKKTEKHKLEKITLNNVKNRLPEEMKNEVEKLIGEYNNNKTKEAKIVNACDKLDTLIQVYFYQKEKRTSESVFNEFFEYAKAVCKEGFAKEIIEYIDNTLKKEIMV
jgi:putative hydrolase of HD superfamily